MPGKSELFGRTKLAGHVQRAKEMQEKCHMSLFVNIKDSSTIKVEFNVLALIARKNISFNFLDSLVSTLNDIVNDSRGIKGVTHNQKKGTYLLTECLSVNSHEMLVADLKKARGFSILCDKATDFTMNKVFCVNVRFLDGSRSVPTTRFYRLIPVEDGGATGLFDSFQTAFEGVDLG